MSVPNIDESDLAVRAEQYYKEHLSQLLEPEHLGKVIAVEPDSGEYILGETLNEVGRAAGDRFGGRLAYFFRVGGAGAVKIGRGLRAGIS